MPTNELETFVETWEREADNTRKLLRALPHDRYDFRPDGGGRSLGELAWHLAELDAYISFGIERGDFSRTVKPPHIERPRSVEGLATGYDVIHQEAVARIRRLTPSDLGRTLEFFAGPRTIRELLWNAILLHAVHHRGQLTVLCRLAGATAPGVYGPNREETASMRAATAATIPSSDGRSPLGVV